MKVGIAVQIFFAAFASRTSWKFSVNLFAFTAGVKAAISAVVTVVIVEKVLTQVGWLNLLIDVSRT